MRRKLLGKLNYQVIDISCDSEILIFFYFVFLFACSAPLREQ